MKPFINNNFLLQNKIAERLFHEYAKPLPIIDYHNHLSPKEIALDKTFSSITEVWLEDDHYKWRAMRANGINETFITGQGNPKEKFQKWAETVPYTMRNPLYHWTHLELQRYFGINELLSAKTADAIYEETRLQLQQPFFSTLGLLKKMKVEVVCTTDNPTDDLKFHKMHAASESNLKMLPTFRPDKFLVINNEDFLSFLAQLEEVEGHDISSYDDLLAALEHRVNYFHECGCRLADHGLSQLWKVGIEHSKLTSILQKRKKGEAINPEEAKVFQMAAMFDLAKLYHKKGWTMQLHLGAIRDNNSRLLNIVGADVGCDSIGDYRQAEGLSFFLNGLDTENKLSKTILYNLNPADNEVFATMAGNFNDGSLPGKVQWGSAWWFLDQKDGMEKQINTLSNMGLLSRFVGMLTDSRSFLSFPRHEYFRRILCNLIGQDVQNGLLPNDEEQLGAMVKDICYGNAKGYFGF